MSTRGLLGESGLPPASPAVIQDSYRLNVCEIALSINLVTVSLETTYSADLRVE